MLPVHHFYPENALLKKHIAYYYFLRTDAPDFVSTYYSFPNTTQSLNLHKHTTFSIADYSVIAQGSSSNHSSAVLQGRLEKPLFVQLRGIIDKITIVFKPLGLNQFIGSPLCKVAGQPSQLFTDWNPDPAYAPFLESFFHTPDHEERITILEAYLLSRYMPFKQQAILERSLELLTDFEEESRIARIASAVGLTEKTFNRLFQKHMGITPIGYRKIARFRHSLQSKLFEQQFKKLTEIGYESNYYDQSYFIKMYKSLSGLNPRRFFSEIDKLANDNLIFQFIRNS